MIKSMTGYGRSELQQDSKEVMFEIKSVNHRYTDFSIRVPRYYGFLEDKIREYLQQYVSRGKINVYLSIESRGDEDKLVMLDDGLTRSYINALEKIETKYGLKNDITVSSVARYTELFNIERKEEDEQQLWQVVKKAIDVAVEDFVTMRKREGKRLEQDLVQRANDILNKVEQIEMRSPQVVEEYRQKINERVSEILQDAAIDENRILTEVAIFADKMSTTEEVVRLKSHSIALQDILKEQQPVGRKLDFLVQEMNREINTIGSKANDLSISKQVVEVKAELEKMREQIQNIE